LSVDASWSGDGYSVLVPVVPTPAQGNDGEPQYPSYGQSLLDIRRLFENSRFLSDRGKLEKITGGICVISRTRSSQAEDNFFEFTEDMGEKGILGHPPGSIGGFTIKTNS
jgi:hypothetical protein